MPSLQELLDRRASLEKEIEETRKREKADAIAKVKALMSQYGLTTADLGGKSAPKSTGTKGTKVAVKYRDRATGDIWSGRGLQPKWLKAALAKGRKLDEFSV